MGTAGLIPAVVAADFCRSDKAQPSPASSDDMVGDAAALIRPTTAVPGHDEPELKEHWQNMLGRTANDLFWMSRYIERAENMARLLDVGYRLSLTPRQGLEADGEWRSTLRSAGCEAGYLARHGEISSARVIDYLLFDADNASSIHTCLATARRNARAQRTAITREMWESLNGAWTEFRAIDRSRLGANEMPRLFDWIKERSALYRGALTGTILRNDTFDFSEAGTFVERADSTARILDVKYYVLLPHTHAVGSGIDTLQWGAILRSVSAHRSYRWVYRDSYRPWHVADFLILNPQMPRSLRSSYAEIVAALAHLEANYGATNDCLARAREILGSLEVAGMTGIFQAGLHDFLTGFIERNNGLARSIATAYHFEV